jgi:hypothetical protein
MSLGLAAQRAQGPLSKRPYRLYHDIRDLVDRSLARVPLMPVWRTSETHPLQIASVVVPGTGGTIGITFCRGKTDAAAASGAWRRSLELDLAAIRDWRAEAVVTLIEQKESKLLKVEGLEVAMRAADLR